VTHAVPHLPVVVENPVVKFSSAPQRPPLRHLGKPSLRTSVSGARRRARGEAPRVLLVVPSYTRVVEPSPDRSSLRALGLDTSAPAAALSATASTTHNCARPSRSSSRTS
jgi:hypothetical protein